MKLMSGVFERFKKLEFIPVENICRWLGTDIQKNNIENKIGNKLLYPQTIPETYDDIRTHLAIFREGLGIEHEDIYSRSLKRLTIPKEFIEYFPDLNQLMTVIIDSLKLDELTQVFLEENGVGAKRWGSVIRPKFFSKSGVIEISIEDQKFQVIFGTLVTLPTPSSKVDIHFKSDNSRIQDRNDTTFEAVGGELGILVDARIKVQ